MRLRQLFLIRFFSLFPAMLCCGLWWGAGSAAADQPQPQPKPKPKDAGAVQVKASGHSTRVILLGTGGGPVPRKFRSQPANLLIVDGRPYLIDAGAGVVRQLALAGYPPARLGTVFITHLHFDHTAGLEPLISFMWMGRSFYNRSASPVQIYGPPSTDYLLRTALDYLSVSERIFKTQLPVLPAAPMFIAHNISRDGLVYRDDKIRVTAVENTHFNFKPGNPEAERDKSYAYRFDTPAGAVVFTGDSGPSAALTKLAEGADLLVSEVVDVKAVAAVIGAAAPLTPEAVKNVAFHMGQEHLIPEEIGRMAAKAHVKAVLLTHFVPGLDTEVDMTPYTAGVKKQYSGPVTAGKDLYEYSLPAH